MIQEHEKYLRKIEENIEGWKKISGFKNDPWWPYVKELPHVFQLLTDLWSKEPQNPRLGQTIRYLINPIDIVPELVFGIRGYYEDLLLAAMAIDDIREKQGALLARSKWQGKISLEKWTKSVKNLSKEHL